MKVGQYNVFYIIFQDLLPGPEQSLGGLEMMILTDQTSSFQITQLFKSESIMQLY